MIEDAGYRGRDSGCCMIEVTFFNTLNPGPRTLKPEP
jgi:hypothetical protein